MSAKACTLLMFSILVITHVSAQDILQSEFRLDNSCGFATCVVPPTQISSASNSTLYAAVGVNPGNNGQVIVTSADGLCSGVDIYSTQSAGANWSQSCMQPQPGTQPTYWSSMDYGLQNYAYITSVELSLMDGAQERLIVSSSKDGGTTWHTPVALYRASSNINSPQVTVDRNAKSPFKEAVYLISVSHSSFYTAHVNVSHSYDRGRTWSTVTLDSKASPIWEDFPDVAIGNDGTVFAAWIMCKPKNVWGGCGGIRTPILFSKSIDGGVTWSPPMQVAQPTIAPPLGDTALWGIIPNTLAEATNMPVLAVDHSNSANAGTLYMTYYNWTGSQMQVMLMSSRDGGTTWSKPGRVTNSSFGDEFFPWVSVSQDGVVGVTWLDRRNDLTNTNYQPFYAVSQDGGKTFKGHQPLSQNFTVPFIGPPFVSFRNHAWAGKTLYATWLDSSTGEYEVMLGGVQF